MGVLSQEVKSARGLKLTTHLHAVQSLCMKGVIPLLPLYALMACKGIILSFVFLWFPAGFSVFDPRISSVPCPQTSSFCTFPWIWETIIHTRTKRGQNYHLPVKSDLDLMNSSFWYVQCTKLSVMLFFKSLSLLLPNDSPKSCSQGPPIYVLPENLSEPNVTDLNVTGNICDQ